MYGSYLAWVGVGQLRTSSDVVFETWAGLDSTSCDLPDSLYVLVFKLVSHSVQTEQYISRVARVVIAARQCYLYYIYRSHEACTGHNPQHVCRRLSNLLSILTTYKHRASWQGHAFTAPYWAVIEIDLLLISQWMHLASDWIILLVVNSSPP